MIHQLPTTRDLLQINQGLPPELRQNHVDLWFSEPIRIGLANEFLRIHLLESHLRNGEERFYRAEVYQPDNLRLQPCPGCGNPVQQVQETLTRCVNPVCGYFQRDFVQGPVRGIVRVFVAQEFVVDRQEVTVRTKYGVTTHQAEWIRRALLVLDRRYDPNVIAAIYRTAQEICDIKGWKLACPDPDRALFVF